MKLHESILFCLEWENIYRKTRWISAGWIGTKHFVRFQHFQTLLRWERPSMVVQLQKIDFHCFVELIIDNFTVCMKICVMQCIQLKSISTLTQLHASRLSHLKPTPSKMGVPPGIWTPDLPHPKPMITHSMPRLWCCMARAFVLIYAYRWWGSRTWNNFLQYSEL